MAAFNFNLAGGGTNWTIGNGGPRFRDTSGVVEFRDNPDTGFTEVRFADGITDDDGVTIRQLNAALFGLFWIDPAETSSITNVALTGEQTLDGILTSLSRVLLTGQTDPIENGVWVTAPGAWARPGDYDTGDAMTSKTLMVSEGTVREDTQWTCTTDPPSNIIDTDASAWAQISGAGSGVTSLITAAGATGADVINTGGPTGAIELNAILGVQGIDATVVTDDIQVGLTTGAVIIRRASFGFADEGTDVSVGTVAPVGFAIRASVDVTVVFDGVGSTAEFGQAADPNQLMTTADIDLTRVGYYVSDINETLVAAAQYFLRIAGTGATTGTGEAMYQIELG